MTSLKTKSDKATIDLRTLFTLLTFLFRNLCTVYFKADFSLTQGQKYRASAED